MKKIFGALGLIGAMILTACGGHGKPAKEMASEGDSTLTNVKHPDWSRNAVIYEVNLRQYTDSGTVTSFAREIPRLKDLGVDILWMMPIHPISEKGRKGPLGSYYAVADYKAFNPEFGTLEQFKDMVKVAHEHGMKVILDWVPNHSGRDNVWVEQHPDWYRTDSLGNMVGLYDWTDVYCFNYDNPDLRKGMIDAMKFWLTEADVDGFRCDVAGEVPTDFWDEARPQLEQVKADVFMLAEASKPELQKNAFDMGYNWPMKDLFSAISATSGQYTFKDAQGNVHTFPEKHASDIRVLLDEQAVEYPTDTYMMNMVTNHDLNSWEGTEFDRLGNLTGAFAVLSYTLPGMPLIYTGQETGIDRAFEFFVKDQAPTWEPRNEYFTFYQHLNALKHNQAALAAGSEGGPMVYYPTESNDVLVFSRQKGDSMVVVMVNLGSEAKAINFTGDVPSVEGMTDYITSEAATIPSELIPGGYRIFVK